MIFQIIVSQILDDIKYVYDVAKLAGIKQVTYNTKHNLVYALIICKLVSLGRLRRIISKISP